MAPNLTQPGNASRAERTRHDWPRSCPAHPRARILERVIEAISKLYVADVREKEVVDRFRLATVHGSALPVAQLVVGEHGVVRLPNWLGQLPTVGVPVVLLGRVPDVIDLQSVVFRLQSVVIKLQSVDMSRFNQVLLEKVPDGIDLRRASAATPPLKATSLPCHFYVTSIPLLYHVS